MCRPAATIATPRRRTGFASGPPAEAGDPHAERRRTSPANWRNPRAWNAKAREFARERGRRRRVFCASLADVFDNQVPEAWRADLFRLIRETPELDRQLLTKRPQNIAAMLPSDWGDHGYANVWLGATTENQEEYDRRWPIFWRGFRRRCASYPTEPALGPLTLTPTSAGFPDWMICGGESGLHARPMDPSVGDRGGQPMYRRTGRLLLQAMGRALSEKRRSAA